jgi:hypothetical protein
VFADLHGYDPELTPTAQTMFPGLTNFESRVGDSAPTMADKP